MILQVYVKRLSLDKQCINAECTSRVCADVISTLLCENGELAAHV